MAKGLLFFLRFIDLVLNWMELQEVGSGDKGERMDRTRHSPSKVAFNTSILEQSKGFGKHT